MIDRRILAAAACLLVAGGLIYATARAVCQHRANYAGGLVFVGRPVNVVGTEYYRLFMWRAAHDQSVLPDARLHVDGTAYALADLTPAAFSNLTGRDTQNEGTLVDGAGALVQYRFENGRLTWFSFDAFSQRRGVAIPDSKRRFALSLGNGPGFTLPIRESALIQAAGKPSRSYLHFAQ